MDVVVAVKNAKEKETTVERVSKTNTQSFRSLRARGRVVKASES